MCFAFMKYLKLCQVSKQKIRYTCGTLQCNLVTNTAIPVVHCSVILSLTPLYLWYTAV